MCCMFLRVYKQIRRHKLYTDNEHGHEFLLAADSGRGFVKQAWISETTITVDFTRWHPTQKPRSLRRQPLPLRLG